MVADFASQALSYRGPEAKLEASGDWRKDGRQPANSQTQERPQSWVCRSFRQLSVRCVPGTVLTAVPALSQFPP